MEAVSIADSAMAQDRLRMLFRTSLRAGQVHPLWQVMQRHRAHRPGPAVPPPPAAQAVTTPLPRLQPDVVQRMVTALPPLPQAALRALQSLRRDDAPLDEVAADLGCDASLTARVLRLANSPFYGVAGRVSSPRDAVQLLGRSTLASLLTTITLREQFDAPRSTLFEVPAFWRHALATAIVSRGLARAAKLDEEQAFVAGLLHDIGLLAMSVYFPAELDALLQCAHADDTTLCVVERRHRLTSHADVGGWIAAHWRFPAPVIAAIEGHHALESRLTGLTACVHVAVAVAHALDIAGLAGESVPPVDAAVWLHVAPDDSTCLALFEQAETDVLSLCAALAL